MISEQRIENLQQLNHLVNNCSDCLISTKRKQAVFGGGDPFSPLLIVGEGPGKDEDESGRPFDGKSGQMLDEALIEAGIHRSKVFVINTVKCRACDWIDGKSKNRTPSKQELRNCKKWLDQQIEILSPRVILCVGGTSAQAILGQEVKVTAIRGILFNVSAEMQAVATLHPAYIMRGTKSETHSKYKQLVNDIYLAWNEAKKSA